MAFAISATTGAILGAAAIGGGAAIIGGNKAAKVQREATDASTRLQQAQQAEAQRQFDLQRADLAPYREAGGVALGQIGRGTAEGGEFNRRFTMADYQADPGAEFRRAEGQRGVEASAAARGGILSGGALKALARYNSDFAAGEFGAAERRYQGDLGNRFNRLASLAGVGQSATSEGNAASQNFVNQQQAATNNIANNMQAGANARASQYVNTANAIGGAANSIGSYFGTRDLLKQFGGAGGGVAPAVGFSPQFNAARTTSLFPGIGG